MNKLTGIRALGRFVNLTTGQEVNVRKGTVAGRGTDVTFYTAKGERKFVNVYDGNWFRLDQPRRKRIKAEDGMVRYLYPEAPFWASEWRVWLVVWKDEDGNQVGEAMDVLTKEEAYRFIQQESHPYTPKAAVELDPYAPDSAYE